MSIRTWDVPASARLEREGSVYPVVTQEDLIKALVDAAICLDRLGGVAGVVLQRVPTGVPNEMVTTRALVTWQDRTNAKPQPEADASPEVEVLDVDPEAVESPLPTGVLDDGLHVDPEAVDESDVPEPLRQG